MCTFHYIILLIATLIILVLGNEGHMTDNVDVELKSWGVISVTELEMAKNGTHPNYHMKDVVRRCNNFELLASNKGANRLFAKAECKGIYGAPNDFKCTFINLDLCLKIDSNGFRKRALGRPFGQNQCQSHDCAMHNATYGKCQGCNTGPKNGDWEYFNLDGLLDSDFGFLTCYGRGGFECPVGSQEMPY